MRVRAVRSSVFDVFAAPSFCSGRTVIRLKTEEKGAVLQRLHAVLSFLAAVRTAVFAAVLTGAVLTVTLIAGLAAAGASGLAAGLIALAVSGLIHIVVVLCHYWYLLT